MKITINDTLQKKGNEQVNKHSIEHEMFRRIIEEKNNIITSKMNIKEVDEIELILVNSKSKISTFLITQETQFPIAYKEGTNQIMTLHPKMTGQLFQNHEEEYSKLLEYALLKMYIHNTYSTKSTNQMGFFYKYCSETAAQILSGKYLDKISEFEIKMYSPGKKITKKDVEIELFFYLLKELSGIDFIYQHLDTIFKEQNVKTSLHTIYKKNFDDLILPLKEKLLEEQRKTLELQKRARQDQRRPMHKINQREDSNPSSANFSNNRNHIHKKFDTKEKKEAPLVNIDKL